MQRQVLESRSPVVASNCTLKSYCICVPPLTGTANIGCLLQCVAGGFKRMTKLCKSRVPAELTTAIDAIPVRVYVRMMLCSLSSSGPSGLRKYHAWFSTYCWRCVKIYLCCHFCASEVPDLDPMVFSHIMLRLFFAAERKQGESW